MALEDNNNDIMNINDPLDINELAALNDDISAEFIEQLQNQITKTSKLIEKKPAKKDVSTLFEEVDTKDSTENSNENFVPHLDDSIDDNFIKKYKAKIEKQRNAQFKEAEAEAEKEKEKLLEQEREQKRKQEAEAKAKAEEEAKIKAEAEAKALEETRIKAEVEAKKASEKAQKDFSNKSQSANNESKNENTQQIESLTNGNIIEKKATAEQIEYNESLDLLDENVKYSKYVIYIDPENTEFIESLTVKERKNLINRILKEQDNIVITKKRLNSFHMFIKHAIIAILTIAIATPIIYFTINASLEATINNHRRSQTIFKTLYKEKGKIKNIQY